MIKQISNSSILRSFRPFIFFSLACLFCVLLPFSLEPQSAPFTPTLSPGQSVTVLSDGRWLLTGGEISSASPSTAVSIWDPRTGIVTQLSAKLQDPRAWHSATVLPDGLVLIFGGVGVNGQIVQSAEIFNPETQSFSTSTIEGLTTRARHTATLLTDGHVLFAGGVDDTGQTVATAELWDALTGTSATLPSLGIARSNVSAMLLQDGRVLIWSGTDRDGVTLNNGEIFDPSTGQFTPQKDYPSSLIPQSTDGPALVASIPVDRSIDVPTESLIALRFSKPLRTETVNSETVNLSGPKGIEKIKVVPAENGALAFIAPDKPLLPGSSYTVTVNGAVDRNDLLLPVEAISFTTVGSTSSGQLPTATDAGTQPSAPGTQSSSFIADDFAWNGQLKDGKPHSSWQDLPALQATPGVTALAGQVLDLKGEPLANVTLEIEALDYGKGKKKVKTDQTGRFLIQAIEEGWSELLIDARHGHNPQSGVGNPKWGYGIFEYGLEIEEGTTNVLSFTIWLPKIDESHVVQIPSPTTAEVVLTSPNMPGLEVHIPPNTVIYDHEAHVVREASLTRIPLDRTPFPLPKNVKVPIYFTAQPGGAYIANSENRGARIYYPNTFNELPGTRFKFWHYDPGYKGWYVYGLGIVPESGRQVIPDPGISVQEFSGAMVGGPGWAPTSGPPRCPAGLKCNDGEPVNLATGLFVLNKTDLAVVDGVMPITLTRTYRPGDTRSRGFGIGVSHSYDFFIVGDKNPYTYIDLILPDGGRIHYSRISAGTSFGDAVYEHTSSQTRYYKSRISWNGGGWDLNLNDGTLIQFPDGEVAEINATSASVLGAYKITDKHGNITSIVRGGNGAISRIIAPDSRWIEFTYGSNNRIAQIKDNSGRTVNYEYDATGRLTHVTDPNGNVTEYAYDALSRMTTIKDARNIVFLTNEYDSTDKVVRQTMADGGIYLFDYTINGSSITQTDVTDPRENVRRVTFNSDGQILTDTRALGKPEEQVTTYNLEAGTNLRSSQVDPLGRTTAYTYDTVGNMTSITRLSGTPDAVMTSYTYAPAFNQVETVTDPLNHITTFKYDLKGDLISVTDPLGHTTTIANNSTGQPSSITDPLGHSTKFTYDLEDVVSITDPLGNATTRIIDSAGRILNQANPLGDKTLYEYDGLNRLTKSIDSINGTTTFTYDPNGNLLSIRDAQNHTTVYTYNNMDRLETRTDPLLKTENYVYDDNGNLTLFTDRKSQPTAYGYDALNRRTTATYADGSSTAYTYDKGNRLTQINDSIAGVIARTYDGLDRLTSETTPQGSVSYTYDNASRRASMTVAGQSSVVYSYDNANRLIQITQGSSIVQFGYDSANRRTSLTLPNGILVEYAYDAVSRVTGITYKQNGTTVLGDLTYEYDKAGNRTKIGGSWARTGIPDTVTTTSYDPGNRQTTFGDKILTYNDNGNLTSITDANGTTIYNWNARNQLAGISGPNVNASFVYDGAGRREKKTINGSLTEFLYDGVNPVQETSGATILANILPDLGIDEFLTRTDVVAGVTSSFLTDALGSPVAVADTAGAVQTEYAYEPFGMTTLNGASNSNSYQYTGRENDGTGLYYYRARFYHSLLQRFISEDPIEFNGGLNLYRYVNDAPTNFTDPFGYGPKDKWYGYNDPNFRWWWHRCYWDKEPYDGTTEDLRGGWEEWNRRGRPPKGKCWNDKNKERCEEPAPQPERSPDGSPSGDGNTELHLPSLPPWILVIPFLPFPGNPLYGGL